MIHIPAMIPLSKIFTLILTAALASAFPDVLANNDVNIEDIFSKQDQNGIVHVIDHPSDQVAEPLIKRALQGYVKKPNSTIVTDPKKPHKENYPVSFTFKEALYLKYAYVLPMMMIKMTILQANPVGSVL